MAISRRSLVMAAGLVPIAAVLEGCDPVASPPPGSPTIPGFATGTLILGEDSGTTALAQPLTTRDIPIPVKDYNFVCVDGKPTPRDLPKRVLAAAYYPQPAAN